MLRRAEAERTYATRTTWVRAELDVVEERGSGDG